MAQRQHLLVLWSMWPNPTSSICAWSYHDPTPGAQRRMGQEDTPPYESVMAAVRDGWRVIGYPQPQPAYPGMELDTGYLKNEFVLERMQETPVHA